MSTDQKVEAGEQHSESDGDSKESLFRALATDLEGFTEKKIISRFVIKVLSILTCMLMVTTGVVTIVAMCSTCQGFLLDHSVLALMAIAVLIGISITLSFSMSIRRTFPINYGLLLGIALSQAIVLAYVTAAYETASVLLALISSCAATGTVATLSATSKWDLTRTSSQLGIALGMLVCTELFAVGFMPDLDSSDYVLGAVGALVFSLYIATDVQLLLGNEEYRLNSEDYVGAVVTMYSDIIIVFLSFLKMCDKKTRSSR